MSKEIYTAREAWERLGISRPTFYKWAKDGLIRPKKLGGRTVMLGKDIDEFLRNLPDLGKAS